jgi:hypothetical protein
MLRDHIEKAMYLTKRGWGIPIGLVAAGVVIAWSSTRMGFPARREDEIILTVGLLGLVLLAYPRLWPLWTFWVLVLVWLSGHILLLWIAFDLLFPRVERMSFWLTLMAVLEVALMQLLLNRRRAELIRNHERRRAAQR